MSDRAARELIADPVGFFEYSYTKMHSIPRERLQKTQLEALKMRVETQVGRIPTLAMLADRQKITSISSFDEALPLFFEHTMYKSYPTSLLEKGKFDALTRWLDKLTVHDLSAFDASSCQTIDGWLDKLAAETALDPLTSSGSTGTMSFLPRDKHDWDVQCRAMRTTYLQEFGRPPTPEDLGEPIYTIWPTYAKGHIAQFKMGGYMKKYFALDSDAHFFAMFDSAGSADLMYLAARLRAAAARGDRSKIDVPPSLLARRGELEAMQRDMAANIGEFMERLLTKLRGKRVFAASTWNLFYDIAVRGLAEGKKCHFAANAHLQTGGGAKGMVLPKAWRETIEAFFGIKPNLGYGMTEITSMNRMCEHGRYHLNPWLIPYVLDPETSKPLPRRGRQTGRAAFFDLCIDGMWGGNVTGDEITVDWDTLCPCGQSTVFVEDRIQRFSEKQGGNDKITCAASPEAHAEALDYLVQI